MSMKWSFRIARIRGIQIRFHWTLVLFLLWVGLDWGLGRSLGMAGALYGILLIGLLFLCVTLHELGHSLVAQRFGVTVRAITLSPIGGIAHLEGEMHRPMEELWMALAGPAVNVVLAILIGIAALPVLGWLVFTDPGLLLERLNGLGFERLLIDLLLANGGLAVFNLLPAFPMDGGRVLRAALATRWGELSATRLATRIGQAIAVLLALTGLFVLRGAFNLVIIAGFVFLAGEQEWRRTQFKQVMRGIPASAALLQGGVALSPTDPLARAIDVTLRTRQANFAVFDRGYLVGVLTGEDAAEGFQQYGPNVPVGRVMSTNVPTARVSETLFDLQSKLQGNGTVVSIVEGGRFLGLATAKSVSRALRRLGAYGQPVAPQSP